MSGQIIVSLEEGQHADHLGHRLKTLVFMNLMVVGDIVQISISRTAYRVAPSLG
jgi:hypothetical protein